MKKSTGKKVVAAAKDLVSKVKKATTPTKKTVKHIEEHPKKAVAKTSTKPSIKKAPEPEKQQSAPVQKIVVKEPTTTKEPAPTPAPVKSTPVVVAPKQPHTLRPVHPATAPAIKGMHGVGRRKSAVARIWLTRGHGALIVNERAYDKYFTTLETKLSATAPFRIVSYAQQYDVHVNVQGGGLPAQADAIKLGFARALLAADDSLRPLLRREGLLTVDSRVKERKKYGRKAARRRFQFVKR